MPIRRPTHIKKAERSARGSFRTHVPGVTLTLVITLVALQIGEWVPILGSAVAAAALGVLIRLALGSTLALSISPGAGWAGKKLLKTAVILLGAGLSLNEIWKMGTDAFAVILTVVALALAVITAAGSLMRLPSRLSTLIAVGTAICGASAVAAASPVIHADEDETAYAISTIFAFNIIALAVYPLLGHLLGLSDTIFGVWAGTAIHDTSSAVAAGYAYSDQAGAYATVVKLARTTLLVPLILLLSVVKNPARLGKSRSRHAGSRTQEKEANVAWYRAFPWFVVGFIALTALRTLGVLPDGLASSLTWLSKLLIVVALAGVGLGADIKRLRSTGFKPLLLGLVASVFVSVASLGIAVWIF